MDPQKLRAIRDWQWLLESAREEGYKIGLELARKQLLEEADKKIAIRYFHEIQELWGQAKTPETELLPLSLDELDAIRVNLLKEVVKRRNELLGEAPNETATKPSGIRDAAKEQD